MKLDDQVALVTGASQGLGLDIARALAREGASIALLARASDRLDRAAAGLAAAGTQALAVAADVTRADEVEGAVRRVVERWGRLDLLVINAGTWKGGRVHETSEADWDFLLDLNLKGAFLTLKHALPWMIEQRRGTIVAIASLGALAGQEKMAAYAASKWGLRGLLESVALDVKPHGIRVSIVFPHSINSEGRRIEPGSPERDRKVDPPDVASMVSWICTAPDHVAVGNVSVWPLAAGIRAG
jgi:NADP-dependent 3-hydroxy acid dehydrogenase YdfG